MKKLVGSVALAAVLATAHAQSYSISLSPEGAGGRTGSGSGSLTLSGNTLSVDVSFSGLSGTVNNAHIHGPAGPFPETAGVLYGLNPITTQNASAGTINGSVTLADGTGGLTLAQQLDQLNGEMWYINIHTAPTFGGGEIRGQIVPVPEPSTYALMGMGLAVLAWRLRRK